MERLKRTQAPSPPDFSADNPLAYLSVPVFLPLPLPFSGEKPKVDRPEAATPPKDVQEVAKQEPAGAEATDGAAATAAGVASVQQESGVPPEVKKASEGDGARADTAGDAARAYPDDHAEVITCGKFFKNFLMGKGRKK